MRSFIDKNGRVIGEGSDHADYCKRILKTTLKRYLIQNIRVKQHRDILTIETLQKTITPDQLKAIRKIYRDYRCLELIAVVDHELYRDWIELRKIVKLRKIKTLEAIYTGRSRESARNSAGNFKRLEIR